MNNFPVGIFVDCLLTSIFESFKRSFTTSVFPFAIALFKHVPLKYNFYKLY